MRDWQLQHPLKVIDKVKAMLLAERTGAEWELLEGNEWEEEEAEAEAKKEVQVLVKPRIDETAILVKPETLENTGHDGTERDESDGKGRGASGWMKLKSR
jgi:phage-related protein